MVSHHSYYQNFLNKQKHGLKLRSLSDLSTGINLDFSTNDYLSLSTDPDLLKHVSEMSVQLPIGSTGSRLLSGNHPLNKILEQRIAQDKDQPKALYFPTGFQANFSTLSALLDYKILKQKPLVFFHKRNHNSLYQAVLKAEVDLVRYSSLEELHHYLELYARQDVPKYLVSETVFGMDGEIVDIVKIKALALKYQLFVYLDEAHATGILGPLGLGVSKMVLWDTVPIVIMGTFSKALGVMGAYIASSDLVIDYLVNHASGFIYSTASSPLIVSACLKAWELNQTKDKARTELLALSAYAKRGLLDLGYTVLGEGTPILPVVIGDDQKALDLKEHLAQRGIVVSCIRAPTVSSARLRIALNTTHTLEQITQLFEALS